MPRQMEEASNGRTQRGSATGVEDSRVLAGHACARKAKPQCWGVETAGAVQQQPVGKTLRHAPLPHHLLTKPWTHEAFASQ